MSTAASFAQPAEQDVPALEERIRTVCKQIPPLWPLRNFVAVNPFVGLSDRGFLDTAAFIRRTGHGDILMPATFFAEQIANGRIEERDFQTAVRILEKSLPSSWRPLLCFDDLSSLKQALHNIAPNSGSYRIMTFAEVVDRELETGWSGFVVDEVSKWCSAYFDQGQSSWRMPWRDHDLITAWRQAARLDANPEFMGLKAFRRFVSALPEDPLEIISSALERLEIPDGMLNDYLYRQLLTVSGWSSYAQFLKRECETPALYRDVLLHLLAVRLAYDWALFENLSGIPGLRLAWTRQMTMAGKTESEVSPDLLARYVAQQALECAYQRRLIAELDSHVGEPSVSSPGRKVLQAVFCIDVRSEVFRRSLEAQSEDIETMGFAGFFGIPVGYLRFGDANASARCPVLLKPGFNVIEGLLKEGPEVEKQLLQRQHFWRQVSSAWNAFRTSAISCFSFVETAGLSYGIKLAKEAWGHSSTGTIPEEFGPRVAQEPAGTSAGTNMGISLANQTALAAGVFRNLGLKGEPARFVLLCGHGSQTSNNPYGSSLDCGACGGHPGDANARIAAAILNNPAVRTALAELGFTIPEDTLFLAGLHNTTTDEVHIYHSDEVPSHQKMEFAKVGTWLGAASKRARRERATSLGLAGTPDSRIDAKVLERSRDWSQVRPEWGLAGNAAFIAAPRERTKRLNLSGRTFLHNYDSDLDAENRTLEMILTAPMVVASWINLQYYASTVNNRLFGSGNKVLHNVVGTFGVWEGNGGDLQTGLPLQSLHDGTRWIHEPLRLSVFVDSTREAIGHLVRSNEGVRELLDNGWVNLFAMESSNRTFWRYVGSSSWEKAES